MTYVEKEIANQRLYAIIGGIGIIIMAIAAGISYGFVFNSLVVQGDMVITIQNILASSGLFTAGIFGWLIILICDIVVAWSLYVFLRPIHKQLSLLAAWFRLVYTCILGIAIANLIIVSILTNNIDAFTNDLSPFVNVFLEAFVGIWSIGLILFGGHLLLIGYLAYHSKAIPQFISFLLMLAALSYLIIHLFYSFLPQWNAFTASMETVLTIPMIIGESGFGLWLLIKGGKAPLVEGKEENQIRNGLLTNAK